MISKMAKNFAVMIAILCCTIILLLNIVYISQIKDVPEEIVDTSIYDIFNIMITFFLVAGIVSVSSNINKINLKRKTKIILFIMFIVIYGVAQIFWINIRNATPAWDQDSVYSTAVKMYEDKFDELKGSQYLELCPQQITTALSFSIIFKLFSTTNVKLLQYINVVANILTVIAIILICKLLENKYKMNKVKTLILLGTFFTLPLLSTFIYGDLMSLSMCLFSVYFIMKYGTSNKKRFAIISTIFMSIGYMLRMNNLIFILALMIYLILLVINDCEERKNFKEICKKIILIILFIIISIVPTTITRNMIQSRLELDKDKKIPTVAYLCMGMQEGYRGNGWYNDYIMWAWEDVETCKPLYENAIVERIKTFIKDPTYCVKFYVKKVASMWTENTYSSLWYNQTFNFKQVDGDNSLESQKQMDELLQEKTKKLLTYQKALIIIVFGTVILFLVKYRKNISNEIILLITIFIGGFLFHILWEAKSRYIIPYILILIPIASISFDDYNLEREIKEMKNIIKNLLKNQIVLYGIFGVLTTLVNLVVFWILQSILKLNENLSNAIAIISAIIFAYVTNRVWVFNSQAKEGKEILQEFLKFVSGRCITMIIEFYACLKLFETTIPIMVSKITVTVVVIILNFFISKFFAFKNSRKGEIKDEKN